MKILDTCALLWLLHDPSKLSKNALSAIKEDMDNCVVSISAWEIAVKVRSGKLQIFGDMSSFDAFKMALNDYSLREVPVDSKIFCSSAALPLIHRDPCDRIIIAAAIENKCQVITADKIFGKYPGLDVIWF